MPTLKSAKKRMRNAAKAHGMNMGVRTEIKTARKRLMLAVAEKNKAESEKLYRVYCSILDKSAKKGIIKKNNAIRRKSRAANKVRAL